jgi:hypothetical protein
VDQVIYELVNDVIAAVFLPLSAFFVCVSGGVWVWGGGGDLESIWGW